jgi:CheY-like chemotaxis protein
MHWSVAQLTRALRIPGRRRRPDPPPAATVSQDAPAPLPPAPAPSLRILLIDDEGLVRMTVAEMLSSLGATVVEAEGGLDGLSQLEHSPRMDLVLTDLGMPGMTGWAVARAVKGRHPSLPVGLITGWDEDPDATPEDRAAVDFTLTKPLTVATLRSAVARLGFPVSEP